MNNNDEIKTEDIKTRIAAFKTEYTNLLNKYEVGLSVYPVFLPNPNGTFHISVNAQVNDVKYISQETAHEQLISEAVEKSTYVEEQAPVIAE